MKSRFLKSEHKPKIEENIEYNGDRYDVVSHVQKHNYVFTHKVIKMKKVWFKIFCHKVVTIYQVIFTKLYFPTLIFIVILSYTCKTVTRADWLK